MKYLKAYFNALVYLLGMTSPIYVSMWLFLGLDNLICIYLTYLVCVSALGGVIGEWMKERV